MDPAALRPEFPILRRQTYLNNCSLGALGRRSEARVQEFLSEWRTRGAPAWYTTWWERLEQTRAAFAQIVGARPDEVALLPSVSAALSVVSSALHDPDRPEVVTSRLDFPTIPYQWLVQRDVKLRLVGDKQAVAVPPEEFEEAIGSKTAAVATSHVLYTTGQIQDAARIARAAKKAGAASIIDAYQSAGQLPIDVRALGCDVLVAGGLKWLLGGPGCALLYVKQSRIAEWEPQITSWFANEHMFEFDTEKFAFRRTAARFELGTHSLGAAFATLGGMETVLKAGVAAIRRRQNKLVTDLYERLVDAGYRVASPELEAERAGILMVRDDQAPKTVEKLGKRKIVVDYRRGRVRVSPYFYNTEQENEKFVAAMKAIAPPSKA